MAKKLSIGLDLDNVLLDFYAHLCDYYNARHGTAWKYDDIKSWHLEDTWGCTNDYVLEILDEFYRSHEHNLVKPIKGSIEAVGTLAPDHELYIITSKPDYLRQATQDWLAKHYGPVFRDVYLNNEYHGDGPRRGKAEVCQEIGVQVFVDDSLKNTLEVAAVGVRGLLFDSPWNRVEIPDHITRVNSWPHAVETIKQFA